MSFDLPAVKTKPEMMDQFGVQEGVFGVPDLMTQGFSALKSEVDVPHPLMASELNHKKNKEKMNMSILRNTQGLHAPLRIAMELKSAKKIGRLPFLASSNVMYDVLTGRDIELGPEDVFNTPEFIETMGQPHAVVEKSLSIL